MKTKTSLLLESSPELPLGFQAAAIHAGIKRKKTPDLTLIVSDLPATVAATFTQNKVNAAPVKWCRKLARKQKGRAVVINSGNANCCTGDPGLLHAQTMAQTTAAAIGVAPHEVYVCSTGTIGVPLPIDIITTGIPKVAKKLSPQGGLAAAKGIMTTDNGPKFFTATFPVGKKIVRLTGLAKGAGMIEPNMATMLCFLLTDADIDPQSMQAALSASVRESFNRISVDGDQSTNDTVLMFANGAAATPVLHPRHKDWPLFVQALDAITRELSWQMIRDGEGAEKVVKVVVKGATSIKDADTVARSVANSLLVKTSWHGERPNWGRVMDAIGYAPARVIENKIDISYDGLPAAIGGVAAKTPIEKLKAIHRQEQFTLTIHLNLGQAESYVYGCDCAHAYIDINI
ncbi:MAG TPA: bifunctional glutamate N-acetyltransferase/amino-acid acetyltransferase ArgJ [Kiritimatiellia bacterium]|nr:bifunctional glutamate N-acetyltransferase/amino-acid acetyltransferase ArgJ [Kiritimatiellia bacterium]